METLSTKMIKNTDGSVTFLEDYFHIHTLKSPGLDGEKVRVSAGETLSEMEMMDRHVCLSPHEPMIEPPYCYVNGCRADKGGNHLKEHK